MSGKRKSNSSAVELAIRTELAHRNKVPCPKEKAVTTLCRAPSFKKWTYTGSVENASALGYLSLGQEPTSSRAVVPLVQSSAKTRRLLQSSSPNPQNQEGQSLIKDEPYSCEPSTPIAISPTPTLTDWIGPSKVPEKKNPYQSRPSDNRTKPRVEMKMKATRPKSTDDLFCEICQVGCSSTLTMRQHLNGRPHKAKLEWMKLKKDEAGQRIGKPMCGACRIWCSDKDGLDMHFKGKKHKAKIQELEMRKEEGGGSVVDKRPILCELCGVHCMDGDLFMMHLKGKQHALKQRGY